MKPFTEPFDFESSAYGLDYAIQIKTDASTSTWLALCFIRVAPDNPNYNQDITTFQSQDIPDVDMLGCMFGTTPLGAEDRNSWWVGFAFEPASFPEAVREVEGIARLLLGMDIADISSGGATVGGPAWEKY